jgi:hypothetical protein
MARGRCAGIEKTDGTVEILQAKTGGRKDSILLSDMEPAKEQEFRLLGSLSRVSRWIL